MILVQPWADASDNAERTCVPMTVSPGVTSVNPAVQINDQS